MSEEKTNKTQRKKDDESFLEFRKRINNILSKDTTVEYVYESDYQRDQRRSNTST